MSTAILTTPVSNPESWLIWKRCLWKESKQILPLLLTLLACGLFLQLMGLFPSGVDPLTVHGTILVLIPALLAVGAGPMLVSQEKELRTLSWIGSLPAPRRTIVFAKFFVGAAALVICWIIGLLVACCVQPDLLSSGRFETQGTYAILWPLNTFFLLLISFSLAWICPTANSALISILPIAVLPTLLEEAQSEIFPGTVLQDASRQMPSLLGLIVNYSVVAFVVVLVAYRYGRSSFIAGRPSNALLRWWRDTDIRITWSSKSTLQTQGMIPSLLWQIATQNRMLLVGAIASVLVPTLCWFIWAPGVQDNYSLMIVTTLGADALMLSWLGTSVFGSDGTKSRIRFLADRGIAPPTVWWTRQILPLGVFFVGSFILFLVILWIASFESPNRYPQRVPPMPWGGIFCAALGVYSFTQWSAQWLRSSLVVFCVAPAVAIGTVAFFAAAITSFGAPYWLIVVSMLIPFVASWVMMGPWMDGRFGWKYGLSHAGFMVVALLIPLIPFLVVWATYPDMPRSVKQSLRKEVTAFDSQREAVFELGTRRPTAALDVSEDKSQAVPSSILDAVNESHEYIEQSLSSNAGPIHASSSAIRFVRSDAALNSLRLDDVSSDAASQSRYVRSMLLLHSIVERLRKRDRLMEQEVADRIERWMVLELQKPRRREKLGSDKYQLLVKGLANVEARNQARRRAIIRSWSPQVRSKPRQDYGGFSTFEPPSQSMFASWLIRERYLSRLTHQLLLHLEGKQRASASESFATFKEAWSPILALDLNDTFADVAGQIPLPGLEWHGEWEQQAKSLIEER